MELGYDMLWKVCSWFLVSFLVARLVSLIVSLSSCNSSSGYVKDSSFKRSAATIIDHDHAKKLMVIDNGRRVSKRVKFDDQLVKVVEFDSVEEVFVRDVEMDCGKVNVVGGDDDDLTENFGGQVIRDEKLVDKESDGGFEMGKVAFDDYGESGEFGEELVDQIVERKEIVGNDEKVGGELESGVIVVDCNDKIVGCGGCEEKERIFHDIKEGIVPVLGNEEVHDAGEDLGGDKVVDDDRSEETSSSNVNGGGGISGAVEFVCHSIEGFVEGGGKEGYALGVGLDDHRSEEVSPSNAKNEVCGAEFNRDEGTLSDDDEWEGIERSELEKKFASAVNFVGCQDSHGRLAKVGSNVVTQLYGLQKIAMEGQCHEPQPIALKLSARAKWNAWQRLGNMSREDAMELYVDLLSDSISEWMEDHSSERNQTKIFDTGVDSHTALNSNTSLPNQDKE